MGQTKYSPPPYLCSFYFFFAHRVLSFIFFALISSSLSIQLSFYTLYSISFYPFMKSLLFDCLIFFENWKVPLFSSPFSFSSFLTLFDDEIFLSFFLSLVYFFSFEREAFESPS